MKKRLSVIIVAVFFFVCIIVAPIALIVAPKKNFSENENRNLAATPRMSFSSVESGQFASELEAYAIDHFPLRDFFVGFKTKLEIMLGKREINNIYVCKNGYYMDAYNKPKNNAVLINGVNELVSSVKNVNVELMLVPTAVCVYKNYLPKSASCYDQLLTVDEIYKNVNCKTIDVFDVLNEHKDERQLYYKTDHHWKTGAAYLAYTEYCKENNIVPLEESDFEIKTATTSFKGTTYSKINDYSVEGESIEYYENKNLDVEVFYDDTKELANSFYEESYLQKKDKYSFFLNNLHYLLTVTNKSIKSDKEIVVIKDSYANCFVPFLANHYKKVYVIDPRNYNDVISDFINEHKNVFDVLILYNVSTLDTDSGVSNIF